MSIYSVTIRTLDQRITYQAIGTSSAAVHAHAFNRFGGLCGVTVKPT